MALNVASKVHIKSNTNYIVHNGIFIATGDVNMGGKQQWIAFYLFNGWTDINITASSKYRVGRMRCGSEYDQSCAIQTTNWAAAPWKCEDGEELICPTYEPTASPTVHPSQNPTIDPTRDPTTEPTVEPTSNPTQDPTNNPTTKGPTKSPTTAYPSHDPTVDPTSVPTSDPTKYPTNMPTVPTIVPSSDPTRDPTNIPTVEPTVEPTLDDIEPTLDEDDSGVDVYGVVAAIALVGFVCSWM